MLLNRSTEPRVTKGFSRKGYAACHLKVLRAGGVVCHADGHEAGEAQVAALLLHVAAQRQRIRRLHAVLAGLAAAVYLLTYGAPR